MARKRSQSASSSLNHPEARCVSGGKLRSRRIGPVRCAPGTRHRDDPDHGADAVLLAIEPVDGRKGIDSLARLCQEKLAEDPFSGCVFVFRSRRGTSIRLLTYDGQGYWLAQKRLSKGRFVWWPESETPAKPLEAYEAQLLMAAGDVSRVRAAPMWRRVNALK